MYLLAQGEGQAVGTVAMELTQPTQPKGVHAPDQSHLHLVSPSHTGMTFPRCTSPPPQLPTHCWPQLVCMDVRTSPLATVSSMALVSHCNTSGRDPQVTWSHEKVTAELPIGSEMFGFWVGPIF